MTFKFELMDTWKKSVIWVNEVLDFTETIPKRYQFSLGDQLRRTVRSNQSR